MFFQNLRKERNVREAQFEKEILDLVNQRGEDKTICPSEVLPIEKKKNKELMEGVRASARRCVEAGKMQVFQKGQSVEFASVNEPIHIKFIGRKK